jgi:hypothetical protein
MSFPSSPSNGQTAIVNGISYTYNSTVRSWTRNAAFTSNLSFGNLVLSGPTSSTSTATGALQITGGAGVTGNVYIGGNLFVQSNATSATYTRVEYNIPHPFLLMGAS